MNLKNRRLLDACCERINNLEDEQIKLVAESQFYRSRNYPWAEESEMRLVSVEQELDYEYDRYAKLITAYGC